MLNQKGFGILLFILTIFFVSITVVGGSFYLKNNLSIFKNANQKPSLTRSEDVSVKQPNLPAGSDIIDDSIVKNFKIIFQDAKDRQFYKGNVDGTDIHPFGPKIDNGVGFVLISPNYQQLLVATATNQYSFYSLDGKQNGNIDMNAIKNQTMAKGVFMYGWSVDGTKIIINSINYPKSTCYELDPRTNQLKDIMNKVDQTGHGIGGFTCYLYDATKKLFVHGLVENSKKLYLTNLNTNIENEFPEPNVINLYEGLHNMGQFFVGTDSLNYPQLGKTLIIYSLDNPNKTLGTITLDESIDSYYFDNGVLWAPDYSLFAVTASRSQKSVIAENPNRGYNVSDYKKKLKIYDRSGKQKINSDLPNSSISNMAFSDDGKYLFIASGVNNTGNSFNDKTQKWQIIDTSTGKSYLDKVVTTNIFPGQIILLTK